MTNDDGLRLIGIPGRTPGRYLMSTHRGDGTLGPEVIVTIHDDLTESWVEATAGAHCPECDGWHPYDSAHLDKENP